MNAQNKPSNSILREKCLEAFGLVEIAIVLIIIGVLAGLGMKGYKLIESAKARALFQQIEDIRIATHMFREKYQAWPGDYARAQKDIHHECISGNGNGLIEGGSAEGDGEAVQFWNHLIHADLANGIEPKQGGAPLVPSKHLPSGKMNGFLIVEPTFQDELGPWVSLSQVSSSGKVSGCLTPKQAAHLDQVFDDGNPLTGDIRASSDSEMAGGCMKEDGYNFNVKAQACRIYFKLFQ